LTRLPNAEYPHPTINLAVDAYAGVVAVPANRSEVFMNTPLAYKVAEACAIARAGRTLLYERIREGELIDKKRGRIIADDSRRWIEQFPSINAKFTNQESKTGS
jgi:hypothetical protein